jgi:hypothetical protein
MKARIRPASKEIGLTSRSGGALVDVGPVDRSAQQGEESRHRDQDTPTEAKRRDLAATGTFVCHVSAYSE